MENFDSYCKKCGYTPNKSALLNMFESNHYVLKKCNIGIYNTKKRKLLLRSLNENAYVNYKDNSFKIFVQKTDKHDCNILSLKSTDITDVAIKRYSETMFDIIFTVDNLRYKLSIEM